jgi:hypothetical protein
VEEIQRLSGGGMSAHAISAQTGIARSTVRAAIKRGAVVVVPVAAPTTEQPLATTTAAITDDDLPQPQLEDNMSIESGAANDFLGSISAMNVPTTTFSPPPDKKSKNTKTALELAESLLGKDSVAAPRKPRTKKEAALIMAAIDEIVPGLDSSNTSKAPKAPKATPTAPPTVLANQPSKADIITQIIMNVEAFEPLLESIIQPDRVTFLAKLYSKSEKELATLLGVITRTRTIANATNQLRHTTFMVAQGAEMVTSKFIGMRTEGFTQSIMTQDQELRMILKEMVLEQIDSFEKYQKPHLRLALLFTTTLMATDAANRMKDLQKSTAARTVSQATHEKHEDL